MSEIFELPVGNVKRRKLMQLLRNRGNFEQNKSVLEKGGFLIVSQRPTHTRNISEDIDMYVACSRCYGYYHRDEVYRHRCAAVETTLDVRKLLPSHILAKTSADVDLTNFFNRMINDAITKTAKDDDTIQEYVVQELDKTGVMSFNTIANKVRLLG